MINKTIFPRINGHIPAITKDFRFSVGRATVSLDSLGNYEVLVNGSRFSSLENTAKRDADYKPAVNAVSLQMATAFDKRDAQFNGMHKAAPRMKKLAELQKEIDAVPLQKYTRQSFPLSRPMRDQIRKELEAEAAIRFVDVYDDKKKERNNFVAEGEKEAMAARLRGYEEIQAFFEELEDGKEARANAIFKKEHDRQKKEINDYIVGEVTPTEEKIRAILDEINLPFRVEVECAYDKDKALLTTDIVLWEDMNIPTTKTNILSTGRISVKDKLVKEVEQLRTETTISMVYYFAASLFNASINIKTQRISFWLSGKREAVLWIQFDRDKFGKLSMRTVNPVSNYYDWPHVDALRVVRGASQFDTIDANSFNNMVNQAIQENGTTAPAASTGNTNPRTDDDTIIVSLGYAKTMASLLPNDTELLYLIESAESSNLSKVTLPKKYKGIMKEIR